MSVDPAVLAAIRAAAEKDPENLALRLHLAGLYLEAAEYEQALTESSFVLARQPDNVEALDKAAKAAEALGDMIKAAGYKRLRDALSWNSAKGLIESIPEPEEPLISRPPVHQDFEDTDPDEPHLVFEHGFQSEEEDEDWRVELPEITLADVVGMENVKRRLNVAFLAPMRNPEMMKLYGKSLKGGLLLYGPPGCGKTYIARAIAGELGAKFISVGITDVVDMYLGQSEKNIGAIYDTARKARPCVLFLDELDALGRKRSLTRDHAGRGIINQLLAEMDGSQKSNEGVFVLAASNHPWDIDSALRRPGRLDRTLLVLPPDKEARKGIIEINMRTRPTEGLDYEWLASKTEDFSGADLAHLCESAAEVALEESLSSGITRPIRMKDFQRVLKEVRPSIRSWLEAAKNHAIYANEGGIYDDLLEYLRMRRML